MNTKQASPNFKMLNSILFWFVSREWDNNKWANNLAKNKINKKKEEETIILEGFKSPQLFFLKLQNLYLLLLRDH